MRAAFLVIALAVLGLGLYLRFFSDVPDTQEAINSFASWFLMIVGAAGVLINLLWTRRKPGT